MSELLFAQKFDGYGVGGIGVRVIREIARGAVYSVAELFRAWSINSLANYILAQELLLKLHREIGHVAEQSLAPPFHTLMQPLLHRLFRSLRYKK